jgi:hypothetical protein
MAKNPKDKDPHSDIPGGHALFRLRQMEQERGLPQSEESAAQPPKADDEKEGE